MTVRGRPESLYTGSDPFFSNWIWFQKRFQQRDSYGRRRNRSWRTVRQDNSPYGLRLTLSDSSTLLVRNDVPTETYGTVKETQGGGFGASSRVLLKYYSTHTPFLTVCGRLEDTGESLMLVKDKRMGFLLSIHTGADQAKIETTKAWLGLAAAPLGYLAALAYFLSQ